MLNVRQCRMQNTLAMYQYGDKGYIVSDRIRQNSSSSLRSFLPLSSVELTSVLISVCSSFLHSKQVNVGVDRRVAMGTLSDTVFTVPVSCIHQHYYHSAILLQHSCLYAFSIHLPVFYILSTLGMDSQFIYIYCIMIGYYQSRLFRTSTYLHKQPVHLYLDF